MKRVFVVLVCVLSTAFTSAQNPPVDRTVSDLIALDGEWAAANATSDTKRLERILADDFFMTTAKGETKNKAQYIADFASGDRKEDTHRPFDYRVTTYGTVAVMTHAADTHGTFKGKDTSGRQRTTHVWVWREGRWQCVANHASRLDPPAPGEGVKAEILEIDRQRQEAYVRGDLAVLRRIISEDCVFGHSDGHTETRAVLFEAIEKGRRVYRSLTDSNPVVRVYGNTATIIGDTRVEALENGESISRRNHFLRVYSQVDGRWQMVANQSTRLATP